MTIHIEPPVAASAMAERIQCIRSPTGVEAWLLEDHTLPIVSMSFAFRGGAAQDPPGKAGCARMLADLLLEGAGPFEGGAFRRALGDKAIRLSIGTRNEHLDGQLQTLARNTEDAFALLGLALREPRFDDAAVDRVRAASAARVRTNLTLPKSIAARAFIARGYPDHAYGRPVDGDLATLASIDRADCIALHRRMATRENLHVAVVGAIDAEALGVALDLAFADLPSEMTPPARPVVLAGLGERIVTRLEAPQCTVYFGRPGIPLHDPDFLAATVVNHCLGGSPFTSRLYREVREKRGLSYSVWSGLQVLEGACTLLGSTATPNDRVDEAVAVIMAEVSRLAREGIEAEEIEKAKRYLIGSHGLRFDTSVSIADLLLTLQREGRDRTWLDARNRHLAAVTLADAARAIERLIGDGSLLVAIAGDPPRV